MNRRRFSYWMIALLIASVGCQKDKYTTIPQVSIKSISPLTVFNGNIIQINGSFTDLEGDIDSVLIVYKWFNGANGFPAMDTIRRTSFDAIGIPAGVRQADLLIQFLYNSNNFPEIQTLPGVSLRDTTASFGIVLIDKAKNRSNYAESPTIRLKKP